MQALWMAPVKFGGKVIALKARSRRRHIRLRSVLNGFRVDALTAATDWLPTFGALS